MTRSEQEDKSNEVDEVEEESEVGDSQEDNEEGTEGGGYAIDLSQNEVYRGICTLFEDEDGNNILEYISLLHTELIGINKSLENLRYIRKDITRLVDCAELFLKGKKSVQESSVVPVTSTVTSTHHDGVERKKKSSK